MKKNLSTTAKVRRLIDQGHTNKAIIDKLGIKPQTVYNIRYQINKERGLGAIGTLPKPTDGIGAPPKKRTRKVRAGTGINAPAAEPAANAVPIHRPGEFVEMPITMIEPPTPWQRVKARIRNLFTALGA